MPLVRGALGDPVERSPVTGYGGVSEAPRRCRWLDAAVGEALDWVGHPVARGDVVERAFQLGRAAGVVPGVLWLPSPSVAAPGVVLLGHGGSGHKRSERMTSLARWFAAHATWPR